MPKPVLIFPLSLLGAELFASSVGSLSTQFIISQQLTCDCFHDDCAEGEARLSQIIEISQSGSCQRLVRVATAIPDRTKDERSEYTLDLLGEGVFREAVHLEMRARNSSSGRQVDHSNTSKLDLAVCRRKGGVNNSRHLGGASLVGECTALPYARRHSQVNSVFEFRSPLLPPYHS
jgi:hypothetical protein